MKTFHLLLSILAFISVCGKAAYSEPSNFGFLVRTPQIVYRQEKSEPQETEVEIVRAQRSGATGRAFGRNIKILRGGDNTMRHVRMTSSRYQNHPAIKAAGMTQAEWNALFQAMIWQESRFRTNARSHKGAMGLAQLMPDTARMLQVDPNDPLQNLDGGARYLLRQLQDFRSPALALAAYNAGPGAVRRYGGIPPYRETRNYVNSIFSYRETLLRE